MRVSSEEGSYDVRIRCVESSQATMSRKAPRLEHHRCNQVGVFVQGKLVQNSSIWLIPDRGFLPPLSLSPPALRSDGGSTTSWRLARRQPFFCASTGGRGSLASPACAGGAKHLATWQSRSTPPSSRQDVVVLDGDGRSQRFRDD
jgi:hypothetical protein